MIRRRPRSTRTDTRFPYSTLFRSQLGKCVIAFDEASAEGTVMTAGFRFDVPVRFAEDRLDVSRTTFAAGEAPSVPLLEIREAWAWSGWREVGCASCRDRVCQYGYVSEGAVSLNDNTKKNNTIKAKHN